MQIDCFQDYFVLFPLRCVNTRSQQFLHTNREVMFNV